MVLSKEKKKVYFTKMTELIGDYKKFLIVSVDNVRSSQLQKVRMELRGQGVMLMGKNTMMRKCLRAVVDERPELVPVLDLLVGNVGMVFFNGEAKAIRDICEGVKIGAYARPGQIAQCDVMINAGVTSLEPTQTTFFQALNIATKITKGQVEILQTLKFVVKDEKVLAGQAALLQKLDIKPFEFGLNTQHVFEDGELYPAAVLDITDEDVLAVFQTAITSCAQVSLGTNYPCTPAVPHYLIGGFKNCVAVALETEYVFEQAEKIKTLLNDPEALAAMNAAAAAPAAGGGAAAAAEPEEEEEEEEEDEDMGFGLFD